MSQLVKSRLAALGIITTHEERKEIDKEIEKMTMKYCDVGMKELTDEQFRQLAERVKKRKRKQEELVMYA